MCQRLPGHPSPLRDTCHIFTFLGSCSLRAGGCVLAWRSPKGHRGVGSDLAGSPCGLPACDFEWGVGEPWFSPALQAPGDELTSQPPPYLSPPLGVAGQSPRGIAMRGLAAAPAPPANQTPAARWPVTVCAWGWSGRPWVPGWSRQCAHGTDVSRSRSSGAISLGTHRARAREPPLGLPPGGHLTPAPSRAGRPAPPGRAGGPLALTLLLSPSWGSPVRWPSGPRGALCPRA